MKRPAAALLGCIAVILLLTVAGIASIPSVQTGTWQPMGSMAAARSGATAVLLQDHRVLTAGGDAESGAVNSAEVFNADGSFSAVSAMGTARAQHVAVALADGRVLVAGGESAGGGATNSAEIYDPVADAWTAVAGGMVEARSGATASLLKDGRVVIAGGQNGTAASATVEIFDPATGQFSFAGTMSSPRMGLASASLADGRVLITGGSNGNAPIASSDIFDPTTNTVSAGPAMTSPREGHSATSLLDGRVLVAGGNNGSADLASAEVFDPATGGFAAAGATLAAPRRDHVAILLPNSNAVLIVGGTSAGNELKTAETFVPWNTTFAATGSPAVARQKAAVSALNQDGLLLMAGGSSAGTLVSSAELYGFATVKTDAADYAPGSVVTITGTGWQPGEPVTLTLVESPYYDTHPVMTAVADGQGHITNSGFSPDEHDIGVRFYLTATGQSSGYSAQNMFTDGNVKVNAQPGNATFSLTSTIYSSANCTTGAGSPVTQNVGNSGPIFPLAAGQSVLLQASTTATTNQGTVAFGYWSGPSAFTFNPATPATICVPGFSENGQQVFNANYNGVTKLAFTTSAVNINANVCSTPLIVQTQSAAGTGTNPLAALTVGLSSTSGGGQFFASADSSCSTPISSVGIANNANTASFRYKDSTGGSPTITATALLTTIASASQVETVNATVPTNLVMNNVSPNDVAFGSTGPVTFTATLTRNDTSAGVVGATVNFMVDGAPVGSAVTSAGGVATFNTYNPSALSVATHNVAASFSAATISGTQYGASSSGTQTLTVGKATPTIAWTNPTDITYGTALSGTQLNATASVPGTFLYTPGPGTVLNAGNGQTLHVDFTPTDTTNYTPASKDVTTNVNKATPTVTVSDPMPTYDGNPHSGTASATGVGAINVAGSFSFTYDGSATAPTDAKASYAVVASFTSTDANYGNAVGIGLLTILKADSTTVVSVAGGESFTYDALAHPATVSVSGVGGLNQSPAPVYSCGHAPVDVADSGCIASYNFPGDANHKPSSDSKTYTIAKADSTTVVSVAGGESFTYDGNAHPATVSVTGMGGLALSPAPVYSCGHAPVDVADSGCIASYSFAGDANHKPSSDSKTYTIAKADSTTVVSVAGGESFIYDGNAHPATVSVSGIGGLSLSAPPVYSCGHAPTDVADSGCIASYSFPGDANHKPSSDSKTYTIAKADSTTVVSVAGGTGFTYDALPHPATVSVTGPGNLYLNPAPVYSCGHAPVDVADSGCIASYSFAGDANHKASSDSKTYTIAKADSTTVVSVAGGTSFTYDALPHPATVLVTGVGGLNLTPAPLYSCGHAPIDAADSGCTASYSFAGDDNHKPSSDTKTYTIAKANSTTVVSVSGGTSFTYDGLPHPATVSVTGVGGLNLTPLPMYSCGHAPINVADSGCIASYSFVGDGNHNPSADSKTYAIAKANPTITVTPYNVAYDGLAHTAAGTAKGVQNETLSGLNLSGTTHTNPGNYASDPWSFTDATGNYNPASGTVADNIGYGVCSAGPGGVILPPINSDGTSVYPRKGGSTIPVKFRVCAANGSVISNPAAVFAGTGGQLTMLSAVRGTIESVNETGATDIPDAAFRFDGSSQWIFNMATSNLSSGNTYLFRINLANGSIQFVVGVK